MAKRILPHIVSNTPGSYTVLIMSRQNHYVRTFNHLDCGSDHLALSQAIKWRDRVLKLVRPSGKKRWTAPYKRKRQDGATSVDFNGVSRCVRQEKRANRTRYVLSMLQPGKAQQAKPSIATFVLVSWTRSPKPRRCMQKSQRRPAENSGSIVLIMAPASIQRLLKTGERKSFTR